MLRAYAPRLLLDYCIIAEYVKQVVTALTQEDGLLLEECLNVSPQVIPGGDNLLKSKLSDVRAQSHTTMRVTYINKDFTSAIKRCVT